VRAVVRRRPYARRNALQDTAAVQRSHGQSAVIVYSVFRLFWGIFYADWSTFSFVFVAPSVF